MAQLVAHGVKVQIHIKIKTRDKKKFTKKFHGGQFSGGHFS